MNKWQVNIKIWQVNIRIWQDDIKIWQVTIIIWQVMAEICHHIPYWIPNLSIPNYTHILWWPDKMRLFIFILKMVDFVSRIILQLYQHRNMKVFLYILYDIWMNFLVNSWPGAIRKWEGKFCVLTFKAFSREQYRTRLDVELSLNMIYIYI